MSLGKPYYRIARPKAFIPDYVVDTKYASDRLQLSRAYCSIEKELRNIFDYIEPSEKHKGVYSFQLYSLLLRACTEVELNCKEILEANGASPSHGKFFNMSDYIKIEQCSKLSKYKVVFNNWRNDESDIVKYVRKEMYPFINFGDDANPRKPDWYKAYNDVKHNRETKFKNANLENCMNAVAGVLVLLYSQFGSQCIEFYGNSGLTWRELDAYDMAFSADVMFEIIPPSITDWREDELYNFEWDEIKQLDNPFEKYFVGKTMSKKKVSLWNGV